MFPRKLPPQAPLDCDWCRKRALTVTSTTFDAAWDEVHAADWLLHGAGRGRWYVLCPDCRPRSDGKSPGHSTGP